MERKLASIRRIKEIRNHPNADLLDLAIVDGWQMVTAKSNGFKEGDLVIYFEIDSFLPVREEFEFLRKGCYKKMGDKEGFRLRTIRLRGELSQGLIIPLSDFFEYNEPHKGYYWIPEDSDTPRWVFEGDDVTERLGVIKWDPPLPAQLAGVAKGNFPSFIPKTDQERIQNIFDKLDLNSNELYEVSIKLDGSSCTVYKNGDDIGVCSRNLDLEESEGNSFWRVARESKLIDALKTLDGNYAVQGELMGPSIQGNRENLTRPELFVFDIYNIDEKRYLEPDERIDVLNTLRNAGCMVWHVPLLPVTSLNDFNSLEGFLDLADNTESLVCDFAEGIVFKSIRGRHSFKVISNKFLLNEK